VQCASDNCETNADGSGGVCCAGDCTGTTPLCSADGAACVCDSASCGGDLCYQGSCCTPNVCEGCLTISCYRGCGLPDEPPNCPFPGACCGPSDSCTFEICL
jgi:hypothetical protein